MENTINEKNNVNEAAAYEKDIYISISGMQFRYGSDFLERGMTLVLEKDPENEYDTEAIKVSAPGLGQIGWVANSVNTVIGDCYSAGRLYDKIGDTATATVAYVMAEAKKAVCKVDRQKPESETAEDD